MFSSRLHWDQRPNALSAALDAKRREGAAVLDLTESNPTRARLPYPAAEILSAFTDARSLAYDPAPAGLAEAREQVAQYYRHKGFDLTADRILLTASTSEAYA